MKLYKKYWMSLRKRIFLLFNKRYFIKSLNGITYLLDIRNRVDRHIDSFSKYEKEQSDFLFERLNKIECNCFIDIGSHWGHYSLLFANDARFEKAEIHSFEPDKVNRYQMYANIFLNKYQDRIKVYEYALSDSEGEINFQRFSENNRGRSSVAVDGDDVVIATKLDSVINVKNMNIGIKIDVEGHEIEVITGMSELLKNNVCVLQVESFPESSDFLRKKMLESGYEEIAVIEDDHYFGRR